MTFVPIVTPEKASTKDKVIGIISTNPGIKTVMISHLLKKHYNVNISYQAVHKLLKQLVIDTILISNGKEYRINPLWIKQMQLFVNKLALKEEEEIVEGDFDYDELINSKETKKIVLKTRESFDEFYYEIRKRLIMNLQKLGVEDRIIFRHFWHLYYPLVHPKEEKELLELVKKVKARAFTFVIGDTPLDEWASRIFKDSPDKVLLGELIASTNMIFLFGNVLMDVYYDYKTIEHFDSVFNNTKVVDGAALNNAINSIYRSPEPIIVTLNKDPVIVNTLKSLFIQKLKKDNLLPPMIDYDKDFNDLVGSPLLRETLKHEFGESKLEMIRRNSNSYIIKKDKESGNKVVRIIVLPPKGFTSSGPDVLSCHPEVRSASILFKGGIKKSNQGYIKLKDGLKFSYYLTRNATRLDDYSEAKIDFGHDLYREESKSSNENFIVVSADGEGFYHNLINVSDEWIVLILKKTLLDQKPLNTEKYLVPFSPGDREIFRNFIVELEQLGDSIFYKDPRLVSMVQSMDLEKILPALIDTLNIAETGKHEQCTAFAIILKIAKSNPQKALSLLKNALNKGLGPSYYLDELLLKIKKHIGTSSE